MISVFKILCGTGLLAIFSSTISKSPALPLLVAHLGGDQKAIGVVAAISSFTGVLFSFPAGILSDKIGRHRMLLLSGVVFATAPFLYLFAGEIWQIGLIRFYHGLATAIFGPVALALVADLYQEDRGEKMGWFSTATLFGRFSAPASGGAILAFYGIETGSGFTWLYIVCGITGLISMTGIFLLSKETAIRQPKRVQKRSKDWQADIAQLLSNRGIMTTCGVEAGILFGYGIFETFLPIRGLNIGLTLWQIGVCLSSQIITIAISKPALGRISDQYGRPPLIITGAFFAGACMIMLAFSNSFMSLLGASILLGLAISMVTSACAAHIADLSNKGSHGSAMGILGSVMDIGHTTGPIVGGMLAVYFGLTVSFISGSLVMAGSGLCFMWFGRNPG